MSARWRGLLPALIVRALTRILGDDSEWALGDMEERASGRSARTRSARGWLLFVDLSSTVAWALARRMRRAATVYGWKEDLVFAVRALRRRPLYAVGVVLTLALGIGTVAAAFTVVDRVVLRTLPFPEPDGLVRVYRTDDRGSADLDFSAAQVDALSRTAAAEGGMGGFSRAGRILRRGEGAPNQPRSVSFARVTEGFLETLRVEPLLGRLFEPLEVRDGAAVVLLSEQLWRSAFGGDPSAVGSVVYLDETRHTVVGVLRAESGFPEDARLWRPLTAAEREDADPEIAVVARRARGRSVTAFESLLHGAAAGARLSDPAVWHGSSARAVPLRDAVLGEAVPRALLVLLASSAMVFLVALTNAGGLLLLRAIEARRDASVRIALGGSTTRVVRGLLSESVLLAVLGATLGLSLATVALPALRALSPGAVPQLGQVRMDVRVSVVIGAVSLLCAMAAGLGPALWVARRSRTGVLGKGGGLSAGIRTRSLRSLVAVQLGLTTILVIAAGLLTTSLRRMVEVPRGFDPEDLVVVPLAMSSATGGLRLFQEELLARVERIPGVEIGAVSNGLPGVGTGMRLEVVGVADLPLMPGERRPGYVHTVSPTFFATVRLPILEGSALPPGRSDAAGAAVVNRSFARAFLGPEPWLGRRFTRSGEGNAVRQVLEVVGVAQDAVTAPGAAPPALLYLSTEAVPIYKNLLVRLKPGAPAASTIDRIHEAVLALDPEQPVNVTEWMTDTLGAYGTRTRFHARLMTLFGALAMALAVVGVYGAAAYGASQRRAELGLRRALGARRAGVVALVLGRSLGASALGIALGAAGAWGVARLLRSLLFEVSPFDPVIYFVGAAGLGVAALVAALAPAVRVARDEAGLSQLLREG